MVEEKSRGPSVRSIYGSPLYMVIRILGSCLYGIECWRMFALMAKDVCCGVELDKVTKS